MTIFFSCYDSSSVSESSNKVIGLPHVTDPQLHDGIHVILFYLDLHLLVEQVLQVHCHNSVHTLGTGSNLSGVYLTNRSSESIHIWTIGTLEGRLSFPDSSPQGPCPGVGLEVKI